MQNNSRFVHLGLACGDCAIAIANNDYSGMSDKRAAEVSAALYKACFRWGWLIVGDHQADCFWSDCFVCDALVGEGFTLLADASAIAGGAE